MPILGGDGKVARFTEAEYERDKRRIKKYAKPSCKKCYGRGWIGKNVKTGQLVPCKCVNWEGFMTEVNRGVVING